MDDDDDDEDLTYSVFKLSISLENNYARLIGTSRFGVDDSLWSALSVVAGRSRYAVDV